MQHDERNLVLGQLTNGNSLYEFTRRFYHDVVPARYFDNWHIPAICEHLQACASGHISKLIINIPPRFMKSTLVSVMFPMWLWSFRPQTRFLYSSYSDQLAARDGAACIKLALNPRYLAYTQNRAKLITATRASRNRFGNMAGGYRLSVSIGGAATGEGGDYVVVDDPHKTMEADSVTHRETVIRWWDETMQSRRNDPNYGAHIVVMQRLHENDLTGHILSKGNDVVHLFIPMQYDSFRHCKTILFSDPRTKEGQLLWPSRYGARVVRALRTSLGERAYEGQYQQNPKPLKGVLFDIKWLRNQIIDEHELPENLDWFRYYDLAYSLKTTADNTATLKGAMYQGTLYLMKGIAAKVDSPSARRMIKQIMLSEPDVLHGVESAIHGAPIVQDLLEDNELAAIGLRTVVVTKDKITRATPAAIRAEQGQLKFVRSANSDNSWINDWIDEMAIFPYGKHDDRVDTVSGVLQMIGSGRSGVFL